MSTLGDPWIFSRSKTCLYRPCHIISPCCVFPDNPHCRPPHDYRLQESSTAQAQEALLHSNTNSKPYYTGHMEMASVNPRVSKKEFILALGLNPHDAQHEHYYRAMRVSIIVSYISFSRLNPQFETYLIHTRMKLSLSTTA
jgi:hypothetical protein